MSDIYSIGSNIPLGIPQKIKQIVQLQNRIAQLEAELAEARKPISDEQIENIIYQCDGFLKWGVGDHAKQMIREKIRAIIKEQQ